MKLIGDLTVITGPMFSGKTELLIDLALLTQESTNDILAFKPAMDTRGIADFIISHKGISSIIAKPSTYETIKMYINEGEYKFCKHIFIDEIQFYSYKIVEVIAESLDKGIDVTVSGLNLDYKGKPFETTAGLMCMADEIIRLKSKCVVCGDKATMTYRINKDKEERLLVGADELYQPRCKVCHKLSE